MKMSPQNFRRIVYLETSEAYNSKRAAQPLNALWALPAYPVFEDEKSNGSDKESVSRKIAKRSQY